jgi:hypothetical protein
MVQILTDIDDLVIISAARTLIAVDTEEGQDVPGA